MTKPSFRLTIFVKFIWVYQLISSQWHYINTCSCIQLTLHLSRLTCCLSTCVNGIHTHLHKCLVPLWLVDSMHIQVFFGCDVVSSSMNTSMVLTDLWEMTSSVFPLLCSGQQCLGFHHHLLPCEPFLLFDLYWLLLTDLDLHTLA